MSKSKKDVAAEEKVADEQGEMLFQSLPEIVTKEGVRLSKFVTSPEGIITHVKD